jgi:hypothetical protein
MAAGVTRRHGETTQHARLKQLAFIWAQTHGFSACAMEVTLPRSRYRADVAGYRSVPKQVGSTAIFECKQALCDLRRDNCRSESTSKRLEAICNRRQFSKRASARIIQTCTTVIRFSRSLIQRTSARSATAVTHASFVSCGRYKIGSTIAQSSKS